MLGRWLSGMNAHLEVCTTHIVLTYKTLICNDHVLDLIYVSKLRKNFPAIFLSMLSENLILTQQ